MQLNGDTSYFFKKTKKSTRKVNCGLKYRKMKTFQPIQFSSAFIGFEMNSFCITKEWKV